MRQLHPKTLEIISSLDDDAFKNATVTKKTVISHAWSEMLKFLATEQSHPKVFMNGEVLGVYMYVVKCYGDKAGCNLNACHLIKHDDVYFGFAEASSIGLSSSAWAISNQFDDIYLFSDAISLYFKGLNILPYIYGDAWRKYAPIENLKEINRVVSKTLQKGNN
jgi:hypothetical protein